MAAAESKTESKGLVAITGASSGIGAAIAKAFSGAGHPLLLMARRTAEMEALGLPNTVVAKVDVTNPEEIVAAIKTAEEAHGKLSCLINNAGVLFGAPIAVQDPAQWKKLFDVNVLGVLNGMKAAMAGFLERESGTVINVSSVAAFTQFPFMGAYGATKAAVHYVTEAARREAAAKGVRVSIISPGVVRTPMLDSFGEEGKNAFLKSIKELPCTPDDIARVALFIYQQPAHVCLREVVCAPTHQAQ